MRSASADLPIAVGPAMTTTLGRDLAQDQEEPIDGRRAKADEITVLGREVAEAEDAVNLGEDESVAAPVGTSVDD